MEPDVPKLCFFSTPGVFMNEMSATRERMKTILNSTGEVNKVTTVIVSVSNDTDNYFDGIGNVTTVTDALDKDPTEIAHNITEAIRKSSTFQCSG